MCRIKHGLSSSLHVQVTACSGLLQASVLLGLPSVLVVCNTHIGKILAGHAPRRQYLDGAPLLNGWLPPHLAKIIPHVDDAAARLSMQRGACHEQQFRRPAASCHGTEHMWQVQCSQAAAGNAEHHSAAAGMPSHADVSSMGSLPHHQCALRQCRWLL